MLEMVQVDYIKHLREKEGCSISEIARRVGISWKTAKKYADGNVKTKDRPKQKRKRPAIGPYEHVVDAWLEEDLRMPKKQRRKAKAIYNQLVELGFTGSDRTVRHYVRQRKKTLKNKQQKRYARLEHAPGTAQADFGEFRALYPPETERRTYHYLVLSFPYSNAQLCRVMPAENSECLFYALQDMFAELNGVPQVIWFDNMSTAVKDVLLGQKRVLTDKFLAFKWHYRFEAKFCNVGQSHEKGHVEGKIGYIRRNWFSPMPVIRDLEDFNNYLKKEMIRDRKRKHKTKDESIETLWRKDINSLLSLPQKSYEVCRFQAAVVNKFGEVTVAQETYHFPKTHPQQEVFLKIYWDKIEAYDCYGQEKLGQKPRKYVQKPELINWAEELSAFKNKPRAIEHTVHLKALCQPLREYLLQVESTERKERIEIVITLLSDFDIREVKEAVKIGLECERTSLADLKGILIYNYTTPQNGSKTPIEEPWTPEEVASWKPELEDYNRLFEGVGLF